MSAKEEMLVIKRGYDLSKWLLDHTGKFPKSYRFSVAAKIENAILDFVEMTTVANMRQDKLPLLRRADEALARLRLLFRLSYELRFINLTSYEYGSGKLDRSRAAGRYGGAPWIAPPSLP
ncbi:MAG: four helix bundle protein [Phycisphaerae bacterium]|nr:four helix bundle protein [Phycisphaerae bacterium]